MTPTINMSAVRIHANEQNQLRGDGAKSNKRNDASPPWPSEFGIIFLPLFPRKNKTTYSDKSRKSEDEDSDHWRSLA